MAADESKSTNPGPFDVRTVKNLVALMASHDLAEIDLRDGTQRLRIRRGGQQTIVTHAPVPTHVSAPSAPHPPPTVTTTPEAAPSAAKSGKKLLEIKSEAVGTFYAKANPEAPAPFVTIGSKVTPNTVIGLIEAMKTYSEIHAGLSGTIAEICVESGTPVEYNQVLFRVEG